MSPPHFNLVDEPWIPVEDASGVARLVGIADFFGRASQLRRIVDPSPLVTAALYRLAFAVFHRAVPIPDQQAWEDAWDAMNALPQVASYLRAWHHRFDLLHPEQPFWQVADQSEEHGLMAWTKLAAELNDNNNKVLFDHSSTTDPPAATAAQVARNLVACQTFAVGGGNSRLGYTFGAPLASALAVIPEGRNVMETLFANAQLTQDSADTPVWEWPALTVQDMLTRRGETWVGIASRLTWPARAVRVLPDRLEDEGGIRWISFAAGLRFGVAEGDRDPWVAYRVTKDGKWVPLRLDPVRAVWRDLHAMIASSEDGQHEPVTAITRLALLENADRSPPPAWRILIAGQASNQARLDTWRQERWSLPEMALHDRRRTSAVADAILQAEDTGQTLRRYAWRIARDLIARDGHADRNEVSARATSLPTATVYWSSMDRAFPQFLEHLLNDALEARNWWLAAAGDAVREAARATHAALGRDARALRAWARTGPRFENMAHWLTTRAAQGREGEA